MSNDLKKQAVARAALEYIEYDEVVGVGTGSTVDFLIEYFLTSCLLFNNKLVLKYL